MKKLISALALVFASAAMAQVSNPSVISVSSAPSGSCSATLPWQYNFTAGVGYFCGSVSGGTGTWTAFGSASGGDSISSPNTTITVGGTSVSTTLDINLGNANTWTAAQTFNLGITIASGHSLTNTGVTNGCATWATGVLGSTGTACGSGGGGDTITSPNSTLAVGGSSTNTTLDLEGAAGEIMAGATPALTFTPALGVDGTSAGTLALSNGSSAAHTVFGSAATTTNTILGPTTVPTTGHILDCTTASTTCTLTDSGVVAANVVNASSPGVGIAHFAGSTQTVTSSTIATADIAANAVTLAKLATQGANTVLANVTGSTAVPTAAAIPSGFQFYTAGTGYATGTAAEIVTLIQGLTGCNTASNVFTPQASDCVAAGTGTVTSVGWTGGIVSVATATSTPAFTIAGTSGGVPYFSSTSTWASSALLAANALVLGGGAGTAPATSTQCTDNGTTFACTGTGGGSFTGPVASSNPSGGVGSSLFLTQEGTAPSGLATSGQDNVYADSTQHGLLSSFNDGPKLPLVQGPASNTTLDLAEFSGTNGGLLIDTGILTANVVQTTTAVGTAVDTSTPVTVSTTLGAQYHFNENATAATAVTYNLPTAAAGKQFCFSNAYNGSAANTGVLTIATSATGQFIIFTDGTLSATGGNITSGGAARDSACVVGVDSTHWALYVQVGSWTKH